MAAILQIAEKQGGLYQSGGWQKQMARRRYQKGTLRKRGKRNPIWELQWREDCITPEGKIERRLNTCLLGPIREITSRQARKLADERLRPLNLGKTMPQSTIQFSSFVEQHFIPNVFPTLKASTRNLYHSLLTVHLMPAFGERRLCDINTLDLQHFVLNKMGRGLGWERTNHLRQLMSKIFGTARKWDYASGDNPALAVELPEKTAVREKHVLNLEQIAKLLAALPEPVCTLVLTALLTGLRVGELLALRWGDWDIAAGQLRIERALCRGVLGTPKTKSSRRILPVPQSLREALIQLAQRSALREPDQLIFQTAKGSPYSDSNLLGRYLKPAGRRLGMPWLNFHTFRRTHATLLQSAGASPKDAQAQLGHAQMSTTFDLYTLPLPAHQREAVENLSRMMANDGELAKFGKTQLLETTQIQ